MVKACRLLRVLGSRFSVLGSLVPLTCVRSYMMIFQSVFGFFLLLLVSISWLSANTGGKVSATADIVKGLLQGMRGAASRESAEQLTARVDKIVVAHGDEGRTAIQKV